MSEYFKSIEWANEFDNLNANESYNRWLQLYEYGCHRFIPSLQLDNNKNVKDPLWMNKSLKDMSRRKRNLWFVCRNTKFKNEESTIEYKLLNKKIKLVVTSSIRDFEKKLANNSKQNPKAVYAYMNSKIKAKESIKVMYCENLNSEILTKNVTTREIKIANTLNKYVVSVFSKEVDDSLPKLNELQPIECPCPEFSELIVKKYIEKLVDYKAVGVDNVHPKVLKKCSIILAKSFDTGVVPVIWLKANVCPLFKKGCKLEPSNYRPISLTSVFVS